MENNPPIPIPIEERIKEAVNNPTLYSPDQLENIWNEYKAEIADAIADEKEKKRKGKMLKKFENAIDKNFSTNWKDTVRMFGRKTKNKFRKKE